MHSGKLSKGVVVLGVEYQWAVLNSAILLLDSVSIRSIVDMDTLYCII